MSTDDRVIHVLCAGAAQGLVHALAERAKAELGVRIEGRFGAVGAMKEALLADAPCDVMIVTDAMIGTLAAAGELDGTTRAALGRVRTGIAVRADAAPPAVDTSEGLRAALIASDRIYFPDPQRATAGIHFMSVLDRLGVRAEVQPKLRPHDSGAVAMAAMAAATEPRVLGCTQLTEILYTPGVALVAPLPPGFELTTTYVAAVTGTSAAPEPAALFVVSLAGDAAAPLRANGGFEAA